MQDEVVASHGVPFDKYAAVVKRLRALLGPDALLVANEGSDLMDWNLTAHSGPPEIRVAPELDLFSLDFYDGWNTDGEWEVDMVRGIYEASVFPQLLPHQKAVLVPYSSDTFSSLFTSHVAKPESITHAGARLDAPARPTSGRRQRRSSRSWRRTGTGPRRTLGSRTSLFLRFCACLRDAEASPSQRFFIVALLQSHGRSGQAAAAPPLS